MFDRFKEFWKCLFGKFKKQNKAELLPEQKVPVPVPTFPQSKPSIQIIIEGKTKTVTKQRLFDLATKGIIHSQTPLCYNGILTTVGKVNGITFEQSQTNGPIPVSPAIPVQPVKINIDQSKTDSTLTKMENVLAGIEKDLVKTSRQIPIPPVSSNPFTNTKQAEIVKYSAKHERKVNKDDEELLYKTARLGEIDIIKKLISRGVNVNAKNIMGNTPLHFAVWHGRLDVVQFLITNGANVNAINNHGQSPLCMVRNDDDDITRMLIEYGAIKYGIKDSEWKHVRSSYNNSSGKFRPRWEDDNDIGWDGAYSDDDNDDGYVLGDGKYSWETEKERGEKVRKKGIRFFRGGARIVEYEE